MNRSEAFGKAAEALARAEDLATGDWESSTSVRGHQIASWIDIADRWRELAIQLPTQEER